MKPRRTPHSNGVFRLEGGTEDNDLWVENTVDQDGRAVIVSVWEPDDAERAAIAGGQNLRLAVWGSGHPPVALSLYQGAVGRSA